MRTCKRLLVALFVTTAACVTLTSQATAASHAAADSGAVAVMCGGGCPQ
ncbi:MULTISPECIES: hypothetical protein [unclassified Streptomyces]